LSNIIIWLASKTGRLFSGVGRQIRVSSIIKQAIDQGCEERVSHGQLATPWGVKHIRFLFNPKTRGRFDLTDYENDEYMLESEISAAERRLSIKTL